MKKLLFITICMIMTLSANAQTEHLKFMGIPLDGPIEKFDKKMQEKGFREIPGAVDPTDAVILYRGVFAGEVSDVYVNYNAKTRIVYNAMVVIDYHNEVLLEKAYEDFSKNLREKYKNAIAEEDPNNAFGKYLGIAVKDSKDKEIIGTIIVHPTSSGNYLSNEKKILVIKYEDWANGDANKSQNQDDL